MGISRTHTLAMALSHEFSLRHGCGGLILAELFDFGPRRAVDLAKTWGVSEARVISAAKKLNVVMGYLFITDVEGQLELTDQARAVCAAAIRRFKGELDRFAAETARDQPAEGSPALISEELRAPMVA